MPGVGGVAPIDAAAFAVLGLAALRGLALGLVREACSLGSIGIAYMAVVLYSGRLAQWIERETNGEVGALVAPWLAGAAIVVAGIAATVIVGRLGKRGARLAGLGWIDRAGGIVLGSAEGLLVIGILLSIAAALLGREHPVFASSRSLVAFERFQYLAESGEWPLPDVAARGDP
jgi:membrane protein required for colicin V production